MLHNCEAGEKAVITGNTDIYYYDYTKKKYMQQPFEFAIASQLIEWDEQTNFPVFGAREIDKNQHFLVKPFETPTVVENFIFSYGKLLKEVDF